MEVKRGKRLDVSVADVVEVYSGPVGVLWEMLMGEEVHVGGAEQTRILADRAKIGNNTNVLDVCCALGGPARHLAKQYGCRVTGLDATAKMLDEAAARTDKQGMSSLVAYKLGSALDMPFKASTFDVVWGQDAWCYVNDKSRLLTEAFRVLKPNGTIAFTDWLQVGNMSEQEWENLNSFMMFPYMETLEGYAQELKKLGFTVLETEDLSRDFAEHCHMYHDLLTNKLKGDVIARYGPELYQAASGGLQQWVRAADDQKVGRGLVIARKR